MLSSFIHLGTRDAIRESEETRGNSVRALSMMTHRRTCYVCRWILRVGTLPVLLKKRERERDERIL